MRGRKPWKEMPKPTDDPNYNRQREIDWNKVDNLLIAGCDGSEIADHIGIGRHTLYAECKKVKGIQFSIYGQRLRQKGDNLLKAAQFDEAINKRNVSMLIWLGKCRLKQKEYRDVHHTGGVQYQVVNYGNKKPLKYAEVEVITPKIEKQENQNDNNKNEGVQAKSKITN